MFRCAHDELPTSIAIRPPRKIERVIVLIIGSEARLDEMNFDCFIQRMS